MLPAIFSRRSFMLIFVQIHHARQPGVLGEDLRILRILEVVLYPGQIGHLSDQIREDGVIDGGRALGGPDESLQAVAGVYDVVLHLLISLALDLDWAAGLALRSMKTSVASSRPPTMTSTLGPALPPPAQGFSL